MIESLPDSWATSPPFLNSTPCRLASGTAPTHSKHGCTKAPAQYPTASSWCFALLLETRQSFHPKMYLTNLNGEWHDFILELFLHLQPMSFTQPSNPHSNPAQRVTGSPTFQPHPYWERARRKEVEGEGKRKVTIVLLEGHSLVIPEVVKSVSRKGRGCLPYLC